MSAKESIAQAQRAIESARALFREGILVECHAYLALALRSLLDVWAPSDSAPSDGAAMPSDGAPSDGAATPSDDAATPSGDAATPSERREQALLALERAKYRHIVRLTAAYRAVAAEAPGAARAAAALGERDFDWIWPEVDRLNRFTRRRFATAEVRRHFRIRLALVLVPIVLVAIAVLSLQRTRPKVLASASFGDPYPPEQAVDLMEATEWLLPDDTDGWIDLTFRSPRSVRSVTLVNCHNGAFSDRSSKKVRVTAFSEHKEVASVEGEFEKLSSERATLELPLEGNEITRVRVDVLSHFGRGGGFADVEVH